MTGGCESTLARSSDIVLDIHVPMEACPLGLAPTASTTATLAMGDALAVVLLKGSNSGLLISVRIILAAVLVRG